MHHLWTSPPTSRNEGGHLAPSGFEDSGHAVQVQIVAPALVSWGLQRLVQTAGSSLRLLGASLTIADAIPLLERSAADVVLLDLDDGHGPDQVAELTQRWGAKVLLLTSTKDTALLARLRAAGAKGVFHKHQSPAQLLRAIESIGAAGAMAGMPEVAVPAGRPAPRLPTQDGPLSVLTARERQTVAAVVADAAAPAKVIAERLGISEHTLRNHLSAIYSKLHVRGRIGLQALVHSRPDAAELPC